MKNRNNEETILHMVATTVTLLSDQSPKESLPLMILAADKGTLEARWEEAEKLPDRENEMASLIQAAANCIRAAATLVEKIDPLEFLTMQLELINKSPDPALDEMVDVPMPPVFDFVESHNLH